MAIRDIFDALTELITNADDRYVILRQKGRIEIEVERRRKDTPSVIRVRDFADGMSREVMAKKLGRVGDRVSGMEKGFSVRGTNSRGAKDVAVLGGVVFESIADDDRFHRCEITPQGVFRLSSTSSRATKECRADLGIAAGTGTVVSLSVHPDIAAIPLHENLREQLSTLVALHDILASPEREIVLIDVNQRRRDVIEPIVIQGEDVLKARFEVPGYPGADAKLIIKKAASAIESGRAKFRRNGFLVKSKRAIHEATLFAPELENDPYATKFFGRLTCEAIDLLWNDYDDRFERDDTPIPSNPLPVIDPMRKGGLTREHPFVQALFGEVLKRLRPLVEEERRQAESRQRGIESNATRKRLRALEKEASRFLEKYLNDDEPSRSPDDKLPDGQLRQKGFSLSPPFVQLLAGHSTRFWFSVRQEAFPEISAGDAVEISTSGDELQSDHRIVLLEPHPTQEGVVRAVWLVKGLRLTPAAEVTARVASIHASSTVEVIESETDKYAWVTELSFDASTYGVRAGSVRNVGVYAPATLIDGPTPVEVTCDNAAFEIAGDRTLRPSNATGVASCRIRVTCKKGDQRGTLSAACRGASATAAIHSTPPQGASIKIDIRDVDHMNQRYFWRGNVLEIAARHPSLRRYLGPPDDFPGQEEKHFRVLLAEIVAEAVCSLLISKNAASRPEEYADYDWDAYYAEYTKLLTEFLPVAHASQVRELA
jgi:hypothetical protein